MLTSGLFVSLAWLRFATSGLCVLLGLVGAYYALRTLKTATQTLPTKPWSAERDRELAGIVLIATTALSLLNFGISWWWGIHLQERIRGAACPYGVYAANGYGFPSLFASLAVAVFASFVYEAMRTDGKFLMPQSPRVLSGLIATACVLPISDASLFFLHAKNLDLSIVTTCCSSASASLSPSTHGSALQAWPVPIAFLGSVLALFFAVSGALIFQKKQQILRALLAGASTSLLVIMVSAPIFLVQWVSPHLFETPLHQCPFCLLDADVRAWGAPLLSTLIASFFVSARALGNSLWHALHSSSRKPTREASDESWSPTLLILAVSLWLSFAAISVWPIAHWRMSYGAFIFG